MKGILHSNLSVAKEPGARSRHLLTESLDYFKQAFGTSLVTSL